MELVLFRAMGSEIFAAVDVTDPQARERLAKVPAMFETWEQRLSRFRPDSELSQLNRQTGHAVTVSDTLWRVLRLAQRAERMSNGLVTPALLDALEAAGYIRSFDPFQSEMAQSVGAGVPAPITVKLGTQSWMLDERMRTVTLARDTRLDLGGVAKGWAAEQTADYLGEVGAALVDAGGDIVVTAPRADGNAWTIGIENPLDVADEAALPVLVLAHGAVATSGRDYRKWVQDGKPVHHLVDPRTRLPALTDVLTATVIAENALDAEVGAKVCLILGSKAGLEWIEARPDLAALLVLEDGRVFASQHLEEYIA